ncbi:MAG: peptidylprolyl isomerase [Alphaproteobacteria bacterium]|jgi:peptidyl-prolyl cis-trans isomerase C|nr:peptidylprolyl isomerase [Alphaproteobacteria bacterium]
MSKYSIALLGASLAAVALLQFSPLQAQTKSAGGAPSDDQVVAIVKGSKVLFRDLRLAQENLPPQYLGTPLAQVYKPLLRQLVERRLVFLAAEAENLADDAEVALRIAQARTRILEQAYLSDMVAAVATEAALRASYEAEKTTMTGADEVRASHILVETEAEADAIVAALQKGGDFAALAKQKSKGPSGAKGGDLGYFSKDKMVPEFANAAFALKKGEVSAPVKTGFGWHVIKLVDRRQGKGPSFQERLPALRQAMARAVVAELLAALAKGADIKIFELDGSPGKYPFAEAPNK